MAKRVCRVDGCERVHYAHGYCNPHWRRWRTNGDPGAAPIGTKQARICSFDGCDRNASSKGLCATHYAQSRRHGTLAPINDRLPITARDDQGRKRCTRCKTWLALDSFSPVTRNPDGLSNACIRCRHHRLIAKRYGITVDDYERLLDAQGDQCAICGGTNASGRLLAVDHNRRCCDHHESCGRCVRGLLCSNCNTALGLMSDDLMTVARIESYLTQGGTING